MQEHLGVGAIGYELATELLELGSKLCVVVDLAVEDHDEIAIRGRHRLLTAGVIDDREPAMAKVDSAAGIARTALGIRAAVRDGLDHAA